MKLTRTLIALAGLFLLGPATAAPPAYVPPPVTRQATAARTARTPPAGELVYDTTLGKLFVGDGSTAGGVVAVTAGTTSGTYAAGDDSRITSAVSHAANTSNPHAVTASQVGLGNVNNTSDAAKPVSTATQAALNLKLNAASNLSDLGSAGTARTNLGLGSVATHAEADLVPWSVISNRPGVLSSTVLASTRFTTTSRVECVPPVAVRAIRLVYGNWYTGGTGETTAPNPITVRASVQPQGTTVDQAAGDPTIPVTFAGRDHVVIGRGKTATSDPVYLGVNAGQRFFILSSPNTTLPAAPSAPALTAGGTGSGLNGTYAVAVTIVYPGGIESAASATASSSPTSGQTITVTAPTAVAGALGYRAWVSFAGQPGTQYDTFLGTVPFGTNAIITSTVNGAAAQAIEQVVGGQAPQYPSGGGVAGGTAAGSSNNGEGEATGTERISEGKVVTSGGAANVFAPVAVLGWTPNGVARSAGLIGDSIQAGTGDAGFGYGRGGFVARAILGQTTAAYDASVVPLMGHTWLPTGGETALQFAANTGLKRSQVTSLCTSVVCNYGTNDLALGSAPLAASLTTIAARFTAQGKTFIQTTIDPKTSSTDGWQTVANQTVATSSEGPRRGINNFVVDTTGATAVSGEAPYVSAGTQGPSFNPYSGGNGSAQNFFTAYPFAQGTQTVTVAGVAKSLTTDYTYLLPATIGGTAYASGITFVSAPANGAAVAVSYTKLPGLKYNQPLISSSDTATAIEVNSAGTQAVNGGWTKPSAGVLQAQRALTGTSSTTVTDSTQTWTQDQWRGYSVLIVSDSGTPAAVGQVRCIQKNTGTVLTFLTAWSTTPSTSAQYLIFQGYSQDGTHPTSLGHMAKALAFDTSLVK